MKELTKEQFETLKPYEDHLTRAKYGRYTYGLRRPVFDELVGIYRELGYTQRADYSCSACVLEVATRLADPYFIYKEKAATEEKAKTTTKTNNTKAKKTNNSKKTNN